MIFFPDTITLGKSVEVRKNSKTNLDLKRRLARMKTAPKLSDATDRRNCENYGIFAQ